MPRSAVRHERVARYRAGVLSETPCIGMDNRVCNAADAVPLHQPCLDAPVFASPDHIAARAVAPHPLPLHLPDPLLKLVNPPLRLVLGHNTNPDQTIDNLRLAAPEHLVQFHLLADLDQALAPRRLHVRLDAVNTVLAGAVPRQREDVLEVRAERLALAEGFDKVGLPVRRVEQQDGEGQV
jgi:hypothetical protein